MQKLPKSASSLFVTLWIACFPVAAITNGYLDGTAHPSVGFIVATQTADPCGAMAIGCTGFLISSDVFLTTGTCSQSFGSASTFPFTWITFAEGEPLACSSFVPVAQIIPNPALAADPEAANIAILILGAAPSGVTVPAPVQLPAAGSVAALPEDQEYTVVAYGTEAQAGHGGGPQDFGNIFRRFSPAKSLALGPELQILHLKTGGTDNPSCFGPFSEAGAAFIGTSSAVASMVTTDPWPQGCPPRWPAQRLDVPSVRVFLADYVILP